MTAAPVATASEPLDEADRQALAELAFQLGAKYAHKRFGDVEAARDHWAEVCAAGLPAVSLSPEYGVRNLLSLPSSPLRRPPAPATIQVRLIYRMRPTSARPARTI